MKTLSSRKHHYLARVSIFLLTLALIAGMVGCGGGGEEEEEEEEEPQYDLIILSTAGGSVTTPGEGTFTRDKGTVVNLVATPASGYQFVNWTGNVGTVGSANAASTTITMNGDYTVTANFALVPPSITVLSPNGGEQWVIGNTYTITWDNPFAAGFSGATNFRWEVVLKEGQTGWSAGMIPVTQSSFEWTQWTGWASPLPEATDYKAGVSLVRNCGFDPSAPCPEWNQLLLSFGLPSGTLGYDYSDNYFSVVAAATQSRLTIGVTPGGTVTAIPPGPWYAAGTVVTLTATPIAGYAFLNWSGDVATVANVNLASTTITMSGNYSIIANFVRLPISPIIFNGDVSEQIDVVFVGSGFPNVTSFNQTILELIDYNGTGNGLMSIEPFRSNGTRFNFWMIETLQTFTNTNFRNESNNLVNSIAPFADEKVVLFVTPRIWDNADYWGYPSGSNWIWTDSGGFGSYVTVGIQFLTDRYWPLYADYDSSGNLYPAPRPSAYNREQVRIAFVHEFGHSFGGLWDEYDLGRGTAAANSVGPPTYTPNADYSPCSTWSNTTSDCYPICGYTDWWRSSYNSIMRDPYSSPWFNTVSTNELLRDMNISSVSSPTSYVLPVTYSSGTFIPGNLTFLGAPHPGGSSSQPSTGYTVQISSASGTILYSTKVGVTAVVGAPSPDWFDEDGNQIYFPHEMLHILDPFETRLILPSFSDAKKISMYDPEGMLVFDVHI